MCCFDAHPFQGRARKLVDLTAKKLTMKPQLYLHLLTRSKQCHAGSTSLFQSTPKVLKHVLRLAWMVTCNLLVCVPWQHAMLLWSHTTFDKHTSLVHVQTMGVHANHAHSQWRVESSLPEMQVQFALRWSKAMVSKLSVRQDDRTPTACRCRTKKTCTSCT